MPRIAPCPDRFRAGQAMPRPLIARHIGYGHTTPSQL